MKGRGVAGWIFRILLIEDRQEASVFAGRLG